MQSETGLYILELPILIRVRFEEIRFVMVCGWVVLTIQQPESTAVSTSLMTSHPLSPFSSLEGFTRLFLTTKQNQTTQSIFCEDP